MKELEGLLDDGKHYRSLSKLNSYVKSIEDKLVNKVVDGEIKKWNSNVRKNGIFEYLINDYLDLIESVIELVDIEDDSITSEFLLELNQYLFKQVVSLNTLCDKMGIEDKHLLDLLLNDKQTIQLMRKIKNLPSDYSGNLMKEIISDYDVEKSKIRYEYSSLKKINPDPIGLALLVNIQKLQFVNAYLLLSPMSDRIMSRSGIELEIERDFMLLVHKDPIYFIKRYAFDYSMFFGRLYDKLISGPIPFVNYELTSKGDFVAVFTSKNIYQEKSVYFSVDRYQISFLLASKLGRIFKDDFIKIVVASGKFLKKPFGDSAPSPLSQRDISDYQAKYYGYQALKGRRKLKNGFLIDSIFNSAME